MPPTEPAAEIDAGEFCRKDEVCYIDGVATIDGGMHICRPTVTGFIRAPFSGMHNLQSSPTDCLEIACLGRPCQLRLYDLRVILITAERQQ